MMPEPLVAIPQLSRRDGLNLLLLVVVACLFQASIVTGGLPLDEDSLLFYYPQRALHGDADVGLWNPYQFCGFPRDANPQSQLLYFPNCIFFLLPTFSGVVFLLIGHYMLGGILMYGLLRGLRLHANSALFGSLVFMLSTFWRCKMTNLGLLEGQAWVPGMLFFYLLALERKHFISCLVAAFFLAMIICAGMPHSVFYSLILLLFITVSYNLTRYRSLWDCVMIFGLTLAGALLLTAGVWGPAWLYSAHTARTALPLAEAMQGALAWRELPHAFIGGLSQAEISRLDPWEGTCVLGPAGLLFVVIGWRSLPARLYIGCVSALVFSIFSTLGDHGWIYPLLYQYIPGWDFFNLPNRALMLSAFILPIFAGFGLQYVLQQQKKVSHGIGYFILAVLSLTLVGGIGYYYPMLWKTFVFAGMANEIHQATISSPVWGYASFLFGLGVTGVVLGFRFIGQLNSRLTLIVLCLLVITQSAQFTQRLFLQTTGEAYFQTPETVKSIKNDAQYHPYSRVLSFTPTIDFESDVRITNLQSAVVPRLAEVFSLCEIQGYDPMLPKRYADFIRAWGGQRIDTDARRRIRIKQYSKRFLDFLGVQYGIGHLNADTIFLGKNKIEKPGRYRVEIPSTDRLTAIHIRWLMDGLPQIPQGSSIGNLSLIRDATTVVQSFPIRAGIETANLVIHHSGQTARHTPAKEFRWIPIPEENQFVKIRQYHSFFALDTPRAGDWVEIEKQIPFGKLVVLQIDAIFQDRTKFPLLAKQGAFPVYRNPTTVQPVYFSRTMKSYDNLEEMIGYL
ncbi:hypothetical protein GF373_08640, partial [bacterium]|nr:hypothetical protein [bacterium]